MPRLGPMPRQARTRSVGTARTLGYAAKAEEYVAAAATELKAGRTIAATSLAIHAAINAADAVCGIRLGKRAAGVAHEQVLALLREAGKDGTDLERHLRRLLPMKATTEYEPDDISASTAAGAVERAQKCVSIARRLAAAAPQHR